MKMAAPGPCIVSVPKGTGRNLHQQQLQSCSESVVTTTTKITVASTGSDASTSGSSGTATTTTTSTARQSSSASDKDAVFFLKHCDQPAEVECTADAMVHLSKSAQKALHSLGERYAELGIVDYVKPNPAPATCSELLFEEKYDKPDNAVIIPRDFFPSSATPAAIRDCAVRHCRDHNKTEDVDNMYALILELRCKVKGKARADIAIQVRARKTRGNIWFNYEAVSFRLLFSTPMTSDKQELKFQGRIGWRSTKKIFLKPGPEATLIRNLSRGSTSCSFIPSLQR